MLNTLAEGTKYNDMSLEDVVVKVLKIRIRKFLIMLVKLGIISLLGSNETRR